MGANTRNKSSFDIQKEIEDLWQQASAQTDVESIYDPKFGKILDQYSRSAETIASQHLQPWIAILEQAISWLVALHFTLSAGSEPITEDLRVPWVLTGAACSQAVAIRKLCLYGLDLPARIVLRPLLETLTICTITTYDKELCKRFIEPEDFYQARDVYKKYFTGKIMQDKFEEIFKELGIEPEIYDEFKDWQKEEKTAYSQAIHTTYTAAALATAPYPADKRTFQPGSLGSATIFSIRTLAQASKAIWYYSKTGFYLLIRPSPDDGKPLFEYPKDGRWNSVIAGGYFVLDKLVLNHWNDGISSPEE